MDRALDTRSNADVCPATHPRRRAEHNSGSPQAREDREVRDDASAVGLLWLTATAQLIAGLLGDSSYIASCGIALFVMAAFWTWRHITRRRRPEQRGSSRSQRVARAYDANR